VEFNSDKSFDKHVAQKITMSDIALHFKHEVFTNEDYDRFLPNSNANDKDDKDDSLEYSPSEADEPEEEDTILTKNLPNEIKQYDLQPHL